MAMILDKLKTLEDILKSRLPSVIMWSEVGIYFPGDKYPPDTIEDGFIPQGYFAVIWHHKRREDNPHPFVLKEVPMDIDNINSLIKRQREKLRNESEKA